MTAHSSLVIIGGTVYTGGQALMDRGDVAFFARIGQTGPTLVLAHGVWLDEADVTELARRRHPRTVPTKAWYRDRFEIGAIRRLSS
jgi:hypothetical protein